MSRRDAALPSGRHDKETRLLMKMAALTLALWLGLCISLRLVFTISKELP